MQIQKYKMFPTVTAVVCIFPGATQSDVSGGARDTTALLTLLQQTTHKMGQVCCREMLEKFLCIVLSALSSSPVIV